MFVAFNPALVACLDTVCNIKPCSCLPYGNAMSVSIGKIRAKSQHSVT